jgi:hypothetical protein
LGPGPCAVAVFADYLANEHKFEVQIKAHTGKWDKLAGKYLTILRNLSFFSLNWGLYYKTFYGHNLQIFVISWSVCPWQAFPA